MHVLPETQETTAHACARIQLLFSGEWGGSQLKFGAQLPHMAMELNPPSCRDTEHGHKGAGGETDVLC